MRTDVTRILIPSGALGLGYDADALAAGIAMRPDLIAIDGGSTDSGPSYLGRGVSKYSRAATKAEWRGLIEARDRAGVPLVIGTAGTCGADSAVDWLVDLTREILAETGLTASIAVLKSSHPLHWRAAMSRRCPMRRRSAPRFWPPAPISWRSPGPSRSPGRWKPAPRSSLPGAPPIPPSSPRCR